MLPKDPIILLSYVNTQLRDNYTNLEDFCSSLGVNKEEVISKLASIDYSYDNNTNQFV